MQNPKRLETQLKFICIDIGTIMNYFNGLSDSCQHNAWYNNSKMNVDSLMELEQNNKTGNGVWESINRILF